MTRVDVHDFPGPHEDCPDLARCSCDCRVCKGLWEAAGRPSTDLMNEVERLTSELEKAQNDGPRKIWFTNFAAVLEIDISGTPGEGEKLAVLYSAICALKKDHRRRLALIAAFETKVADLTKHPCTFIWDYDDLGSIVGEKCVHCDARRSAHVL